MYDKEKTQGWLFVRFLSLLEFLVIRPSPRFHKVVFVI